MLHPNLFTGLKGGKLGIGRIGSMDGMGGIGGIWGIGRMTPVILAPLTQAMIPPSGPLM